MKKIKVTGFEATFGELGGQIGTPVIIEVDEVSAKELSILINISDAFQIELLEK
jgi:hypothetical protein